MLHACRIWNEVSSGLQKAFSHRTIRSVMHQDITPQIMQKRFVPLYISNKGTIRPYCARNYVARMPNLEQGQFRSPKSFQSQNHQVCDASRHHSSNHAKAFAVTTCATSQNLDKVSSGLQKAFSHRTIRSVMHQDITPQIMQKRLLQRPAQPRRIWTRSVQVSKKPSVTEPSGL